ncbi:MAG: FAD dependent oxidoreductase [Parcubacteria group bacterium Athens0416_74]|nr:MAG: FAD dependent oxidoreductase [Parcubacteria group bacterium Athens0416_74]
MKKNSSPWIRQLNHERPLSRLSSDISTDVTIIGAGIAGVSTAFFTLKHTDKKVVMLERFKLAHGATGHNAGQVVSYFERGFASLAREFGLRQAADAESSIVHAWELIDEMYTDAGLDIPFSRFTGHGGLTSFQQVKSHLEANKLRREGGIASRDLLISESAAFAKAIPEEYAGLYTLVPQGQINELLETKMPGFLAVISFQKGVLNSALFCQEVVLYLLQTYPDRFSLYEHTPVHKVILHKEHAVVDADTHVVDTAKVVLCTNGFESLHIINEAGLEIDAKYHHLVKGKVGYMSGYLEDLTKSPTAISYYTEPSASMENDYFYLTRRPYEYEKGRHHNLISVGGPAYDPEEGEAYNFEDGFPDNAGAEIDAFIHRVYDIEPHTSIEYAFTWHGLMGYTRNGVRLIGPEPQNPILLYNLGCNGVGILPSIHGGRIISRHLAGEKVGKSIFDVPVR